jgi:hypothetical protein
MDKLIYPPKLKHYQSDAKENEIDISIELSKLNSLRSSKRQSYKKKLR